MAVGLSLIMMSALFILGAQPFAVGLVPEPWDKLAHAGCFFVMALLVNSAFILPRWLLVLIPLLVSMADEIHQIGLPGRSASVYDWLAGAIGVGIANYIWWRFETGNFR